MRRRLLTIGLATGMALTSAAVTRESHAQAPQPQLPTTVQLPTFRFFTVNTTVSVPDRGSASLGGISRGSDGSTSRGFGPLRSRGIGSARSASTMSVHATIIDHAELDRAVLAEAAGRRGTIADDGTSEKAEFLSRNIGRGTTSLIEEPKGAGDSRPVLSVTAIRQQAEARAAERDAEAATHFAKAQALEAEGKPTVAKIYYQMVARRASGNLKSAASARIAVIDGANSIVAARGSE